MKTLTTEEEHTIYINAENGNNDLGVISKYIDKIEYVYYPVSHKKKVAIRNRNSFVCDGSLNSQQLREIADRLDELNMREKLKPYGDALDNIINNGVYDELQKLSIRGD